MKSLLKTALFTFSFFLASPLLAANPIVDVQTNMGNFKIELYPEVAPITVKNFLKYVEDGSYVGTQFHRIIPGFVVQGGGFDAAFNPRPSTFGEIKNESKDGLPNNIATLSMARTADPDSATRQFYINLANNNNLNAAPTVLGYTVFGKVIKGFNVVEDMSKVKTMTVSKTHMSDVPQKPIVIEKIDLVVKEGSKK